VLKRRFTVILFLCAVTADRQVRAADSKKNLEPGHTFDTWIGITPAVTNGRVQVLQIYPNGPAHKVGLKVWDYLISLNGHNVKSLEDFYFCVRNTPPGKIIKLKYERKSEIKTAEIKIEKKQHLPDSIGKPAIVLALERYTDGKRDQLSLDKKQIKILIFVDSVRNLKDALIQKIIGFLKNRKQDTFAAYGITYVTCESVRPIPENNTQHVCNERRIKNVDKYRPLTIYYDDSLEATLSYRIDHAPAIIIVDQENIIRYANYASENTIENVFAVIEALDQKNAE